MVCGNKTEYKVFLNYYELSDGPEIATHWFAFPERSGTIAEQLETAWAAVPVKMIKHTNTTFDLATTSLHNRTVGLVAQ